MISDETFRKKEHILKSRDFGGVYKRGYSSVRGGGKAVGTILYCLPNGLGHNRIGFSVSSKNFKKASARNRLRRLFRETFRLTKSRLKQGFDMVLVIKKAPAKTICYKDAENIFLKLTQQAMIKP